MSNDLPHEIKEIIEAQTTVDLPRVTQRSVLPKIGSYVNSSDKKKDLEENFDEIDIADTYRTTPIHMSIKQNAKIDLDYSEIPNNELLHSTPSTARGTIDELTMLTENSEHNRRPHQITLVDMKLANLPSKLPEIHGLRTAIENLSTRRLHNILEACRLYDWEKRGYLNEPSILKCIGEVIPSVHSTSSPWRSLLNFLAPEGEFIEYEKLARLIHHSRPQNKEEVTIPDVLASKDFSNLISTLPSQASPMQEMKEKGRAQCQVMTEIEVLLMRNPELDLDRLKMATVKKTIAPSEMTMLLELYGLEEHFKPFQHRLINSFLTHDDKFHFSAFIACLNHMRPLSLHQTAIDTPQEPPWNKAPLAPIGTTTMDPTTKPSE